MTKIKTNIQSAAMVATASVALLFSGALFANPVILPDPVASNHFTDRADLNAGSKAGFRVVAPPTKAIDVSNSDLAVEPIEPAAPLATVWTIKAGQPIHTQVREWATLAGWDVRWALEKSWLAPADVEFSGDFLDALSALVNGLYQEGKPVRLKAWKGNRYAEIVSSNIN